MAMLTAKPKDYLVPSPFCHSSVHFNAELTLINYTSYAVFLHLIQPLLRVPHTFALRCHHPLRHPSFVPSPIHQAFCRLLLQPSSLLGFDRSESSVHNGLGLQEGPVRGDFTLFLESGFRACLRTWPGKFGGLERGAIGEDVVGNV